MIQKLLELLHHNLLNHLAQIWNIRDWPIIAQLDVSATLDHMLLLLLLKI